MVINLFKLLLLTVPIRLLLTVFPNVKSVLWTGMPGAEYGPALVDVLFGDYYLGGRLVFTLAKNDADFGTDISTTYDSNYTEGVLLDYRHFDKYNITGISELRQ